MDCRRCRTALEPGVACHHLRLGRDEVGWATLPALVCPSCGEFALEQVDRLEEERARFARRGQRPEVSAVFARVTPEPLAERRTGGYPLDPRTPRAVFRTPRLNEALGCCASALALLPGVVFLGGRHWATLYGLLVGVLVGFASLEAYRQYRRAAYGKRRFACLLLRRLTTSETGVQQMETAFAYQDAANLRQVLTLRDARAEWAAAEPGWHLELFCDDAGTSQVRLLEFLPVETIRFWGRR